MYTEYDFVNEVRRRTHGIFILFTAFNTISSLRDINPMDSSDALFNESMIESIAFDLYVTE